MGYGIRFRSAQVPDLFGDGGCAIFGMALPARPRYLIPGAHFEGVSNVRSPWPQPIALQGRCGEVD